MKTPWKHLYDWTNPIIRPDVPYPLWNLQYSLWFGAWGGMIAVVLWLVEWLASMIAPESGFSQSLDSHFLAVWLVSCGFYFFYWFFRIVWDGLKEPTVIPTGLDRKDV